MGRVGAAEVQALTRTASHRRPAAAAQEAIYGALATRTAPEGPLPLPAAFDSLETLIFRRCAYTVQAVVDAGVDPRVARTLLADGPRALPERAFTSLTGRRRTKEPIREYVWGPDAIVLLQERGAAMAERQQLELPFPGPDPDVLQPARSFDDEWGDLYIKVHTRGGYITRRKEEGIQKKRRVLVRNLGLNAIPRFDWGDVDLSLPISMCLSGS